MKNIALLLTRFDSSRISTSVNSLVTVRPKYNQKIGSCRKIRIIKFQLISKRFDRVDRFNDGGTEKLVYK